ncbi:hypothetical protein BH11BAC3_BH11BAC3_08200 [soil metagenome]
MLTYLVFIFFMRSLPLWERIKYNCIHNNYSLKVSLLKSTGKKQEKPCKLKTFPVVGISERNEQLE